MYCKNCGAVISENTKFCNSCGQPVSNDSPVQAGKTGKIGYSSKVNDPAFAAYLKNSNRWSAIFSVIIAVIAVVGFFIAGEMGVEDMENPQALFIGFGIGSMFLLIAFFQILGRNHSKTWDGSVIDKTIKKKTRQQRTGDDDYYTENYTEYTVFIREDSNGKIHRLSFNDDDTVYNYYQIGDHVRHHAGLKSYEKYDKSKDSIIFCNACGTLCSINDDICFRCKCPLLK
ncbi:MAG: zinc ribbon domain-containing protein [Lachnospiraceae bacterium]|nr:zinc ribbon domain-containing protein [Lachnospiraceae bacterium]